MSDQAPGPGEPCPTCGRPDPRDVVDQLRTRTRARTQLMTEAAELGLSPTETAELVTGVRTFPREDTP